MLLTSCCITTRCCHDGASLFSLPLYSIATDHAMSPPAVQQAVTRFPTDQTNISLEARLLERNSPTEGRVYVLACKHLQPHFNHHPKDERNVLLICDLLVATHDYVKVLKHDNPCSKQFLSFHLAVANACVPREVFPITTAQTARLFGVYLIFEELHLTT